MYRALGGTVDLETFKSTYIRIIIIITYSTDNVCCVRRVHLRDLKWHKNKRHVPRKPVRDFSQTGQYRVITTLC